jgi:hypothetical protein
MTWESGDLTSSSFPDKKKGAPLVRDAFEVFRLTEPYSFLEASSKMSPRFVRSEAPVLFENCS